MNPETGEFASPADKALAATLDPEGTSQMISAALQGHLAAARQKESEQFTMDQPHTPAQWVEYGAQHGKYGDLSDPVNRAKYEADRQAAVSGGMEKARAEESTKGAVDDFANNVEEINAAIDAGTLNGIGGKTGKLSGQGESGKQYRRIDAGLEALRSAMQQNGKSPAEIADTIERLTPGYLDTAATLHDKVNGIATELNNYGAQLSNPSKKVPTSEKGKAPKPGTVVDGYRFKGGDPNDQKNWEPVGQ